MFMRLSPSRRALSASVSLLFIGGALSVSAPQAHADEFLVGALLFGANSNGDTLAADAQYDTNAVAGSNSSLPITFKGTTSGRGISFDLLPGSNALSFVTAGFGTQGSNDDLGLFFSSSNTSYNPTSSARTPDLLVSRANNGSTAFFFPGAGTLTNSYVPANTTAYSGATSFTLGADTITVTSYSVDHSGAGTFTVQVGARASATPEPGSVALLVGMGMTGVSFAIRRKRRK